MPCRPAYRVSKVWHALISARAFNCCNAISFSSVRCQLSAAWTVHQFTLFVRPSVRPSIPCYTFSHGDFMVASIVEPATLWTACPTCPPLCGIGGFAQLMQLLLRFNSIKPVSLLPSLYSLSCLSYPFEQLIRHWQIDSALSEAANLTALCMANEGIFNSDWFERDYLTTFDLDKCVSIESCHWIIALPDWLTDWLSDCVTSVICRSGWWEEWIELCCLAVLVDNSDKTSIEIYFVWSATPPCTSNIHMHKLSLPFWPFLIMEVYND